MRSLITAGSAGFQHMSTCMPTYVLCMQGIIKIHQSRIQIIPSRLGFVLDPEYNTFNCSSVDCVQCGSFLSCVPNKLEKISLLLSPVSVKYYIIASARRYLTQSSTVHQESKIGMHRLFRPDSADSADRLQHFVLPILPCKTYPCYAWNWVSKIWTPCSIAHARQSCSQVRWLSSSQRKNTSVTK